MEAVLHAIGELAGVRGPVVLAIGVFDGVHLGHQAVIQRAQEVARASRGSAVVLTFDPHPARVLRPDGGPRLLTTTEQKLELILGMGVERVLLLRFDQALASREGGDFVRDLAGACRPLGGICVGRDWSFGRGRSGNFGVLKALGAELGFEAVGVEAVGAEGAGVISSTVIRTEVEEGRMENAAQFLGRPYAVRGEVVRGQELGRRIGFPTANLAVQNDGLLRDGVYAVRVRVDDQWLDGVLNLGKRPTVVEKAPERVMEVHLLGFHGDLYGKRAEVEFYRWIRPEQRFDGVDALRGQIARDCEEARDVLSRVPRG
jgi:riboflavin kinase/FMN adenylyltransferase